MSRGFYTIRPGRLSYRAGLALQQHYLRAENRPDADLLILTEHPPTITLGRKTDPRHLLTSADELQKKGIEIHQSARGGSITYHGPGQLVGYPLIDLTRHKRDLHLFLRTLEEVLIAVLRRWDIPANRREQRTGVWVGNKKIASIGIGVQSWVSWHGFALNVSTDLNLFQHIVPCGLQNVQMTSMQQCLGTAPVPEALEDALIRQFADSFAASHMGDYEKQTTTQA